MKRLYLFFILLASLTTWTQLQASLTNNFNESVSVNNGQQTIILQPGESYAVPTGITSLSATYSFGFVLINWTGTSMNIFTNYIVTNDTTVPLVLDYNYPSGIFATAIFTINPGQSLPLTPNMVSCTVKNSAQTQTLSTTSTTNNTSYLITNNGSTIQPYTPTFTFSSVNNVIATAYFYNYSGSLLIQYEVEGTATYNMPSNTTYITITNSDNNNITVPSVTIPAIIPSSTNAETETVYGIGTITNNTSSTVTVIYSGYVNGSTSLTALNATPISIAPGGFIYNITGCQSVTAYNSTNGDQIATGSISADSSYFINNDNIGPTAINPILTNNYGVQTYTIYSVTSSGLQTQLTTALQPWSSLTYPSSGISFLYVFINSISYFPVLATNQPINTYTGYTITNNTPYITTFLTTTSVTNAYGHFSINPGQSMPIPTDTLEAAISVNGTQVIPTTPSQFVPVAPSTNYQITYNSSASPQYNFIPYNLTLNNNYNNGTATGITYYNSNGGQVSTTQSIAPNGSDITVPGSAAYATLTELGSQLTIPITLPSGNIFTGQYIINNSSGPIGINYSGIYNTYSNIPGQPLNPTNTPISIPVGGTGTPIMSGTSNISVFDNNGNAITYLTNQPIQNGTPYYVTNTNGLWYLSSTYPLPYVENNSSNIANDPATGNAATNVTFYNATISSSADYPSIVTLPAGGDASIPTGSTYCQLTTMVSQTSGISVTIAIPENNANTKIFGSGTLINNTPFNVTVNYTGPITTYNDGLNLNYLLNNNPIPLATSAPMQIITGTTTINVYYNGGFVTSLTTAPSDLSNTSYYINNVGGVGGTWSITTSPIINNLTNNNTYPATNVTGTTSIFLDINNDPISPATTSIDSGSPAPISNSAVTAYMNTTIPDNTGTTTVTNLYTPVSDTTNSNVYGSGSVTNNSGRPITIVYSGELNTGLGTTFNQTAITVNNGGNIKIITGATLITVYQNGQQVIPVPDTPAPTISANTNYFINFVDNQWDIDEFAATNYLYNNFNQTTGAMTFYSSGGSPIETTNPIAAWGFALIPASPTAATTVTFTDTFFGTSSTLTIPVVSTVTSNIFSEYILTNNYTNSINVTFYGYLNGALLPLNSSAITIPAGESMLFLENTIAIAATATGVNPLVQTTLPLGLTSSYSIIDNAGTLTINEYTPTLINNSSTNLNINFFQANGTQINSASIPFNMNSSVPVPGNATSASIGTYDGTTLNIATQFAAANNNLFTPFNITNIAEQTVTVNYYGLINGNQYALMNDAPLTILAGESLPILTSTPSSTIYVEVIVGGITEISQTSLNPNTSYFINYDASANPEWFLSTTIPLSNSYLYNNSTASGTNLVFNSSNGPIDTPVTINSYTMVQIPLNAITANLTELGSNLTIPVNETIDITDIFTGFVITNNTTAQITLNFYNVVNGVTTALNNPDFIANPTTSTAVLTGSTNVVVKINGQTVISISQGAISAFSSYFVLYNSMNGTYYLSQVPSPSQAGFTNNYTQDATNLIFYNSTGVALGGQSLFPGSSTAQIPVNTTSATLVDFNIVSLQVPIANYTTSSNLFSGYVIENNAGQTINIQYSGLINGVTTPFNIDPSSYIPCLANLNSPLFTGAATFYVYDATLTLRVTQQIAANTSYIIDNNWNVTPVTGQANLTNNFSQSDQTSQSGSNLYFYNSSGTPIGNPIPITTFAYQGSAAIPTGAVKAQFTDNIDDLPSTITVPVTDTVSLNVCTSNSTGALFTIINNDPDTTINIALYGTVNGFANTLLNSNNGIPTAGVEINPGSAMPIITGAQNVSIIVGGVTEISHFILSPNTTYYVNFTNGIWTINTYTSVATLTNNYQQNATNLTFYNGATPLASPISFPQFDSVPTPTTATSVSMIDFGSTLTLPIGSSVTAATPISYQMNSDVFTPQAIANNTGETIGITFYNTPSNALNSPYITRLAGVAMPIVTGTAYVSVYNSVGTIQINQQAIDANTSYYIIIDNGVWQLLPYTNSSAILTNNYSQAATNLYFSYNGTPIADTENPTTFYAYGIAGIPSTSTTASFTETFNSISSAVTIPVSDSSSSNAFLQYSIFNTTSQTIGITYYGTVNGTSNTAFNATPFSMAPAVGSLQYSVPILTNAEYLTVTVGGSVVLDTSPDLLFNSSYNINYESGVWFITPRTLSLMNNSNQQVDLLNFYDSSGNIIGSPESMYPWSTISIPAGAATATAQFNQLFNSVTVSVALSNQTPSRIFTNSLLINNSQDDISIVYYGTLNGTSQSSPLNDVPVPLIAGQSAPFVSGTLSVSVILNGQTIISKTPIQSNAGSYEINNTTGYSISTRAIASSLQPSNSAIALLRFLGGATETESALPAINLYGQNQYLFQEFLYVDSYLEFISDKTARSATSVGVHAILDAYGNQYANQRNFNYILNANNLIVPNLVVAQQTLADAFPASAVQITKFFTLLFNRINILAS